MNDIEFVELLDDMEYMLYQRTAGSPKDRLDAIHQPLRKTHAWLSILGGIAGGLPSGRDRHRSGEVAHDLATVELLYLDPFTSPELTALERTDQRIVIFSQDRITSSNKEHLKILVHCPIPLYMYGLWPPRPERRYRSEIVTADPRMLI